jgi:hypothetical protein
VTGGDGRGGRDSSETSARGGPHAMLGARGRSMDGMDYSSAASAFMAGGAARMGG